MIGDENEASRLSDDTEGLFEAIGALLAQCTGPNDAELRPAMRVVVAEARAAGLYAEMLLRLLKESWRSLPAPMSTDARMRHFEMLNRVVSLCIREFYRTDNGQ